MILANPYREDDEYMQGSRKKLSAPAKHVTMVVVLLAVIAAPLVILHERGLAAVSNAGRTQSKANPARSVSVSTEGLITAGPSRKKCVETPRAPQVNGVFQVAAEVNAFEAQTGTSVSCLTEYANGALTWKQWTKPVITATYEGVTAWVAKAPKRRQLVLQVDLIPMSLEDQGSPMGWERSCAAGNFDAHAKKLGTNLVAAGLGNSVLRLGAEMNGPWEADFVGTTRVEQKLWATCFANEVTALRQAAGEHFLIDWNPSACVENIPYANFYPGDAYVDILGLDLYDKVCSAPAGSTTKTTWNQLAREPNGLEGFESFAEQHAKPMSFPEWGLVSNGNRDDPAYINGMAATIARGDFAFEGYFDSGTGDSLPLGASTPLSLAAFRQWFHST
ncbi:MAG TPA: glycosyl hydrolase [Acidimicrobiales bacterium]|nr:glycosyl hydrolase [Acidimicrobiales bacterium]